MKPGSPPRILRRVMLVLALVSAAPFFAPASVSAQTAPVPRPVADTLSYRSTIDADAGLEKCAAAPLPCTPYLPDKTVRLRVPARGIRGGFVAARAQPSGDLPRCIGTVLPPFTAGTPPSDDPRATQHVDHCSATTRIDPRSQERR